MPEQESAKVALVTGASRGIGKAIAIDLAGAGYDVAILARTVHEGEAREHSSTLKRSDTSPLPGSLDSTAEAIRASGQQCLAVQADLLDHPSLVHAVSTVLAAWGHIDVLVNNGRYIGPGHMDFIIDTPVRVLRDHLEANALAPVVLIKEVLPQMIERGGGTVINITSTVVQPGFIATERMQQDMGAFGFDASAGAPVAVVGKVCRWLLESSDATALNVKNIEAQELCSQRGLLPGWSLES